MIDISALTNSAGYLLEGVFVTLLLVALSLFIGFVCGIVLTLGQVYGPKVIKKLVGIYVWFFRGLPNIVLLFLFYFALFPFMGLDLPAFFVAVTVLGMRSAAYQSQIFRGAIESIASGQMLAARSLGMTKWQAIRSIILPDSSSLASWLVKRISGFINRLLGGICYRCCRTLNKNRAGYLENRRADAPLHVLRYHVYPSQLRWYDVNPVY